MEFKELEEMAVNDLKSTVKKWHNQVFGYALIFKQKAFV